MSDQHPLSLAGQYGSPYSLKMRAVLRYRHIPFRWVLRDSKWDDLPEPPVRIIPVIVYPNPDGSHGEATIDSSPQIMRLEGEVRGRSVVPTDPALAFIDMLDILTQQLSHHDFLLGDRPGRGDFGIYGQLTQLTKWDPTSVGVAVARSPKTVHWVDRMDDLSWLPVDGDAGWVTLEDLPAAIPRLLSEIGQTYAPFLVANDAALRDGADEVVCQLEGGTYRQGPFKYQAKCLRWLRDAHQALADSDRSRVDAVLAGTGCEVLFD